MHRGFYEGARQHAESINGIVQQVRGAHRDPTPVWVTGHSLGGGYANALLLHLLAQRQGSQLFSAGVSTLSTCNWSALVLHQALG